MTENALVRRREHGEIEVTDAGLEQITRLAAEGVSDTTIAKVLGVNRKTFGAMLKEDGDECVIAAYYQGKGRLADECIGTLLGHMRSGNVTACIFACKSLLGLRDTGNVTAAPAAGNAVQVNISVPAPMSAEEFQKMIEVKQHENH